MSKIMIVEDDESLREIYSIRLTAEGYNVISAHDGEEALAIAIKERPDLIISDVMMPKITGFDMLDILRSTPETQNIRVIMMTALSSDDQRVRGENLGADRYLVKSQVGIEDVVNVVHEVLGDSNTAGVVASVTTAAAPGVTQPVVTPESVQQITPATTAQAQVAPVPQPPATPAPQPVITAPSVANTPMPNAAPASPAVAPAITPAPASQPVVAPVAQPTTPQSVAQSVSPVTSQPTAPIVAPAANPPTVTTPSAASDVSPQAMPPVQ